MGDAVFTLMLPEDVVVKRSASPGRAGSFSVAGVPWNNSGVTPRTSSSSSTRSSGRVLGAVRRREALVIIVLGAVEPVQIARLAPVQNRIDDDVAVGGVDAQQIHQPLELQVSHAVDRNFASSSVTFTL